MDKNQVASSSHLKATLRWVDLTVALVMVHRNMRMERDYRRAIVEERLARWKGNRQPNWEPTAADLDQLVEATTRWAFDEMQLPLFSPANAE